MKTKLSEIMLTNRALHLSMTLLMLITLISMSALLTPEESHATIKGVTSKTKWIMMGDSYSVRPKTDYSKTWPKLLQKSLSLKDSEVSFIQKSGYGIARETKNFYAEIKKFKSSRNVKKILIQSGIGNDRGKKKADIEQAFKDLDALLRKKYPNAKVYYMSPNWYQSGLDFQILIAQRKSWYRVYAKNAGWTYIEPARNMLIDHTDWSEEDQHHPKAKAVKEIADTAYKFFKGKTPKDSTLTAPAKYKQQVSPFRVTYKYGVNSAGSAFVVSYKAENPIATVTAYTGSTKNLTKAAKDAAESKALALLSTKEKYPDISFTFYRKVSGKWTKVKTHRTKGTFKIRSLFTMNKGDSYYSVYCTRTLKEGTTSYSGSINTVSESVPLEKGEYRYTCSNASGYRYFTIK